LDTINRCHFEVGEYNLVSDALVKAADKCIDSILAIDTKINVIVNIDPNYIQQCFYGSKAKFFVVYDHYSAKFERLIFGIQQLLLLEELLH
jgi:hypothetical protein